LLAGLVVPLAVLALITGVAAVVRAHLSEQIRWPLPVAGAVAGTAVLLTAVAFPHLLGPSYGAAGDHERRDPTAIRAVPLPGKPAAVAEEAPDWVDAGRAALHQGDLRLQIAGVWTGPEPTGSGTPGSEGPNRKGPRLERLFIRLRVQQVPDAGRAGGGRPAPPRRDAQHPPTLTDNTGKIYQTVKAPGQARDPDPPPRFPVAYADEVLAFEAPPSGVQELRLEVPAAGWGHPGAFRFTIPGDMIKRQPPEFVRNGGG
jgi:hypothetical protein